MRDKSFLILAILALIWFTAVLLWSKFVPSFFLKLGHGKAARTAAYVICYSIYIFIWGWLIPFAIAIYDVLRKYGGSF